MKVLKCLAPFLILIAAGCARHGSIDLSKDIDPGDDPNFRIEASADAGFDAFNRKVEVFGIPVYAVPGVDDGKLLHAANIMAQYLDNDEDGVIDNQAVADAMLNANAFLVMWKSESDLDRINPPGNAVGQDLGNDETIPAWHTSGHSGRFDASLEEVWHLITHAGYAGVYPDIFGEVAGSKLAQAMDAARGGRFIDIPAQYPEGAWYTYDDPTCDYSCMVTEYFYWAQTSMLGAQENRLEEIEQEWDLNSRALVQSTDGMVYDLLTDPCYKLPAALPDGSYRR